MKKIFIYARRSNTKGQWVSISIEKQIEEMDNNCRKNWYEIVAIYKDNKSSYTSGKRDDFTKMLEAIEERNTKKRGERIDAVMVYMASRLCRNRKEAHIIEWMVEDETIQFLSIKEKYGNDLSSKERFIHDINAAIYESKHKSVDAKKNMDQAGQKWRLTRKPPYWYKVVWRGFDSKVVFDEENKASEVIKKAFELYGTGKYHYDSLAEELNRQWYRKTVKIRNDNGVQSITTRKFDKKDSEWILINKFYWWKVEQTYTNLINEEREYFIGIYGDKIKPDQDSITIDYTERLKECWTFIPLITREIFEKCEMIRRWNRNGESKEMVPLDMEYAWKSVLRCSCKLSEWITNYLDLRSFTIEAKIKDTKKEKGKRYLYYRCSCNDKKKCTNVYMNEIMIDKLLTKEIISKLHLTNEELLIFRELISIDLEKLKYEEIDIKGNLEKNLEALTKEVERLKDRIVNEPDEELLDAIRKKYYKAKEEKEVAENQLKVLPDVMEDDRKKITEYIGYIEEISDNLLNYSLSKKRALLKAIFEYVILYDKKIVKFKLKPFFEFVYNRKIPTDTWKGWGWVGTETKKTTEPKNDLWSLDVRYGGPTWDWTRDQSVMSRLL